MIIWPEMHALDYNLFIKNNFGREYAISNSPGDDFLLILLREL
jgi:hypothetical protein